MRGIRSLAKPNGRSTRCAFPSTTTTRLPERTTSLLQSTTTTMEQAPATWTFGLVFQQAIDRQDRTLQTEGRFSLLEPLEIHPGFRTTPTTGRGDHRLVAIDMPRRTPHPIEATPAPTGTTRPSRKPTPRRRQTSHRIAHPLDTNSSPGQTPLS